MADFPSLRGASRATTVGPNTATSGVVTLSPNASPNTKGSWTEIVSAAPFEVDGFMVFLRGALDSCDSLIDIAIGAAASEQVIVSNIAFTQRAAERAATSFWVPLKIPSGQRISARCQTTTGTSNSIFIYLVPVASGLKNAPSWGRAVALGAVTADSGGTSVDPGGTINTKGSYSELTASLDIDVEWIVVNITNQANTAATTALFLMDIAIGAGGSEQVIVPNLHFIIDAAPDTPMPQHLSFPVSIPKGQRVSVRAQSSINDATDRLFDVVIIGVG